MLPDAEYGPVFPAPEVPIETGVKAGPYTEHVTRQLCAAAFARPNRLAAARKRGRQRYADAKKAVRKRLRFVVSETPSVATASTSEPQAPDVVIGDEFSAWVRKRIGSAARPAPTFAFDQPLVLRACERGVRRVRWRRVAIVLVVLMAGSAAVSGTSTVGWAVIASAAGSWMVFLVDRYVAQRALNAMLTGDLPAAGPGAGWPIGVGQDSSTAHAAALPYTREMRNNGPRDRFIGAGLQAWSPAVIGIDVEPAPVKQDDERPLPFAPSQPATSSGDEVAAAVLAALSQHSKQSGARKQLKHFTVAQLHAYVAKRLADPAPTHDRYHPIPRTEVLGIAGIAHSRWDALDAQTWKSLQALAANDTTTSNIPAAEIARRYIWARITGWGGELVASVLVHFAYQGGFLRVTVRPHIMAPLNPAVAGLAPANPRTARWLGRAALHAAGDLIVGTNHLLRRTPQGTPELDPGSGPVSLREIYSLRFIDDMHMNDDARYYVQMMQRRVFDSTEIFLRDHNVDIAAYRQQSTAIYNFGVMNGGTITGDVQAAPFASDIQMN